MSAEYADKDPLAIAKEAERDLNSPQAKQGHAGSDSTLESGVDEAGVAKFPGGSVQVGSAASGAGDNREIPVEEGGDVDAKGRTTKARDFEGEGGPETKAALNEEANPGSDDVGGNVRMSTGRGREEPSA